MRPIIEITVNGDPYSSGFIGTEYQNQEEYDTGIGIYRGDVGARSRSWWRDYCRRHGYTLRYD